MKTIAEHWAGFEQTLLPRVGEAERLTIRIAFYSGANVILDKEHAADLSADMKRLSDEFWQFINDEPSRLAKQCADGRQGGAHYGSAVCARAEQAMKLADVINLAIERCLWDGDLEGYPSSASSCAAIHRALCANGLQLKSFTAAYETSLIFLADLGCRLERDEFYNGFPQSRERQYARALWLTWAAMIAEEEGIEI
jgi:hypothetical protein